MFCFYHSADLDGMCSAAIVRKKYPNCKLKGINYNQEFPYELVAPGEKVIMVDFGMQPASEMKKLIEYTRGNFIWIDHHISAINDSVVNGYNNILGLRDTNFAGCELAWQYFYPESEMPLVVTLLGRYDVWDHSDQKVLPFQYGMKLYDTWPDCSIWEEILSPIGVEKVNEIIKNGEIIYDYEERSNKRMCKTASFEIIFEGYKFLSINRAFISSKFFDSKFSENIYDGVLAFSYNDRAKKWGFSMYTTKDIDLSIVAQKYGGGGHAKAGGFSVDEQTMLEIINSKK